MGGKAYGLALLNQQLQHPSFNSFKDSKGKKIRIAVPPALIITTEFFDIFLKQNQLDRQNLEEISDDYIAERFGRACLPEALDEVLRHYLRRNRGCLAVRSSGLMEDTRRFGYAGLYCSVMFPNDQPDIDQRLDRLRQAIKRVYASTFFKATSRLCAATGPLKRKREDGGGPPAGHWIVAQRSFSSRNFRDRPIRQFLSTPSHAARGWLGDDGCRNGTNCDFRGEVAML